MTILTSRLWWFLYCGLSTWTHYRI